VTRRFESRIVRPPVGRLAPSPTGALHLGHARSFLAAWWSARSAGGRVVMRIEDLDTGRCRPEYTDGVLRDLEWLGLDWDGAILVQSEDPEPYRDALERLLASGAAYACTCSRSDIQARVDAPHGSGGELRYPGTCRGRWSSPAEAERAIGRAAGIRLRVEPGPATIDDAILGPFSSDVAAEVGDVLLARRDGAIAYQLAVVVDDARQGVTEVVRGRDLLPSAVRQAHVQVALALPHPVWAHVPLVTDAAGRRLAKRDGDAALATWRERGADPRGVVSAIARSLGLGESAAHLDARSWLPHFHLAKVPRGDVRDSILAREAAAW
jgi:glutamyl-tRNA synthetase